MQPKGDTEMAAAEDRPKGDSSTSEAPAAAPSSAADEVAVTKPKASKKKSQ